MKFKPFDLNTPPAELEKKIVDYWKKNKIFEKSVEQRKSAPLFSFYDGPPFATGTPHYGHIVASAIKDVIPRYKTMKGFRVDRKWGWDCHGLPIENIVEKKLAIKKKKEIYLLTVEKFNATAKKQVLKYVDAWEKVIERLGRWVDMKNSYKTMDLNYMESVWWVFKQLWDKNLIYENYRSLYICPRCETTLAQSEVAEGYRETQDISVIAKFKILNEQNSYFLAWTTTPWTLLGNSALAVGKEIQYVEIKIDNENYILAKDRLSEIEEKYQLVKSFKSNKIIGKRYLPLIEYYLDKKNIKNIENAYQVVEADFVTTDEGTGIVHIAPAFGEEDLMLSKAKKLPLFQHIGMDGIIDKNIPVFGNLNVKDPEDFHKTDIEIIKYLAEKNLLFKKEKYTHSYPHCWRCETPLLNYATNSFFVSVEKIKEKALKNQSEIQWIPKHIKAGRFGKWLEGARDWSISRQRFWASTIPVWQCKNLHQKVFGSIADLEKISQSKIIDLHKEFMDKIEFPCPECQEKMKRVEDVLDCWFESGSMPFAQLHSPFENRQEFNDRFPADFIAEGIDQTRTWFYYLHIIASAIENKYAFKNVIVNGIVLAENGKKMSKRLNNYPDPMVMIDKYSADVLRYYLLSSSVVTAENINFSEGELADNFRHFYRMLKNSYGFFLLYSYLNRIDVNRLSKFQSENILDKWIISKLNLLIKKITFDLDKYRLNKACRLIPEFIDDLSNWYIRRSRKRFWKNNDQNDLNCAISTLYDTLVALAKIIAPIMPFIAEEIFCNLTAQESVHLENYPEYNEEKINNNLIDEMERVRNLVSVGLAWRLENKIKIKQPLLTAKYSGNKLNSDLEKIMADELNVKKVELDKNVELIEIDGTITDELKKEGQSREIVRIIQEMRKKAGYNYDDQIRVYIENSQEIFGQFVVDIEGETISKIVESKIDQPDKEENYQGTLVQIKKC